MTLISNFKKVRKAESRPLRLLVLLDQARPTGLVRQLLESLSSLTDKGVVVATVFCIIRKGVDPSSLEFELRQRGLAFEIIWEEGAFNTAPLKVIRSHLAILRPEAIQSHGYKPAVYALILRRAAKIPWIAFYHGRTTTSWKVRIYNLIDRWAMGRANMIITVAKGVERHFRPADRSRLRVVPNAVVPIEPSVEDAKVIRERYGIEGTGPIVGFIGRLSKEKGPDLFLEVFVHLTKVHPGIRGLIVGDGPMRLELEKRASELGIDQYIRFAGQVTRVSDIYRAIDVLLICSRSEVFPNVLLEAVNTGLPVAATPVGGIPWVAANLDTVVLATDLSPTSIAAAVTNALKVDIVKRTAAQEQITKLYSRKQRVEMLSAIYLELKQEIKNRSIGSLTEIIYCFETGGSERIAQVLAEQAMKEDVKTTVCSTHGGPGPISILLDKAGIENLPLNVGPGGRIGRALRLYLHLRQNQTKVLHVQHFNMLSIAYWPARIARVQKIVVTEHTDYEMRTRSSARRIARRYGRRADLTTVVHQSMADYLINKLGFDAKRVQIIPNGVDTQKFLPGDAAPLRHQLGIPPGVNLIGYVGRLHPHKDPMNLLRAIASLSPKDRDRLHVVFVGEGSCRDEMERFIHECHMESTIQLIGERQDIPELMQAMDVYVLPSYTEGSPVSLLEAMSCGLPIVATAVDGVPGILGDCGLIVERENPEALSQAVMSLLDDPKLRIHLGKISRCRVIENFDRSLMFDAYWKALQLPKISKYQL